MPFPLCVIQSLIVQTVETTSLLRCLLIKRIFLINWEKLISLGKLRFERDVQFVIHISISFKVVEMGNEQCVITVSNESFERIYFLRLASPLA